MAAFSTGADWSFPADLPGSFAAHDRPEDSANPSSTATGSDRSSPRANSNTEGAPTDPPLKRRRTHYPSRQCRICLEVVQPTFHQPEESSLPASFQQAPRVTYESEDGGRLLSPCKCKGSQKYVHEECLGAWRRADPLQKRNYWECPTCRYRYRLQRLTWSSWISSTAAQLGLTVFIFVSAIFLLGFVADPIIALYVDPVHTIANAGSQTASLIWEDEPVTWYEHMAKGMASLGLLGFAKFLLSLSPLQWFNARNVGWGRSAMGGTGRDRLSQLSWITIAIGIVTFLYAVWKGVRAWSRRTLESAGERVLDVPGTTDDDDEDD